MLTATASYRAISADIDRSLGITAKRPVVARETEYYLEKIGDVKSIDDFMSDDRLYRYAMKAFGLEDMSYAKAFMRKVLEEGTDASDSFANSLSDPRYREFAEAFNFKRYASATTSFERTQQGTADRYVRQTLEEEAGLQDEGVRLALYFERKAEKVDSVYDLLGDKALLTVVQVAFGFSEATGALDIDKQAAMFAERLDIEDLKDPEKLQSLLTRFTTLWETQKAPAAASGAAVLFGQPVVTGVGMDLLMSIQNLRLGGN